MAMFTPISLLQDPTRCLATAAPLKLHVASRVPREFSSRSRTKCHLQILKISSTDQAIGSRGPRKFSTRANGAPPGDLLTEDITAEEDPETCEIVQGSNVTLGEGQDAVQAYFIQAIKNNNGVGVLCLTDEYGFENEDSRSFAYRLACFGYNVLVPDLFQGVPWSEQQPKSEFEEWKELHSPDRVAENIDVATEYLVQKISVGKLVVLGFGFGGGRMIETLARDSKKLFATGAFLYGTGFDSSLATQLKVPLLLIAGDGDLLCSPAVVRQIEQAVPGSKAKIYPGFGHAFAHRPNNSEEDEVSEDAFNEIRQWLHDRLSPTQRID